MLLHQEMGFQEKDPEAMKQPMAGISPPRTPLIRSINTRPNSESGTAADGEEDLEEYCSAAMTPTAKEARIPERLPCPPAPRKRRPPPRCRRSGGVEFFSCPPDLEAVFMRRPEKAQ